MRIFQAIGGCVIIITAILILAITSLRNNETAQKLHKRKADVSETAKKRMEFDDWLNGKFSFRSVYPYWVSGTEFIQQNSNGSLVKVSMRTKDKVLFLDAKAWEESQNASSWAISADQEFVAFMYNHTDGYAHYVRTFSISIWNATSGQRVGDVDIPEDKIQNFKWSPSGHSFAFVYGFNVYVNKNFTLSAQLTFDGNEQLRFNGISDWMYSVEIADDDVLFWWSPDSQYLAYLSISHSEEVLYEMTLYKDFQYPQRIKFPYPKPGFPIPQSSLYVVDVETMEEIPIQPNVESSWDEYYLNSAVWRGNIFTPTWKNRNQNEAITESCIAPNFQCSHGSEMKLSSSTGWLGNLKVSHIFPLDNADEYITVESHNGYSHIAVHNTADNTIDWRTEGEFEVTDTNLGYEAIHYYDAVWDWIYFTSTEVFGSPGQGLPRTRHVWRVKGHGDDRHRECQSCQWNYYFPDDRCLWVNSSFSLDGTFMIVNCYGSGNGTAVSILLERSNLSGWYGLSDLLEENKDLENTIAEYELRSMEFGSLKLPDLQEDWYYLLLKPPNFNPNKKYPLLVQVYGGPGFQEVVHLFSITWKDYVASSKEVVVMSFDGRGTGFRGDQIRNSVYKALGQFEALDQINAVKEFIKRNSYIDASRIAIWGKSYGGYVTTRVMNLDHDNVFRCGFALAPVTRWEYYSTIWTERYMLQPNENEDGYMKGSAIQNWENFKTHRYAVYHGTRDENVHFQHAAQLSKYLVGHDVEFRAFFSTDDDHGFGRVPNNYRTVFKSLTKELDICFSLN